MKDIFYQLYVLVRSSLLVILTCGTAILFSLGLVFAYFLARPFFVPLLVLAFLAGMGYVIWTMIKIRKF
jgi:Sec-independent protein secretion pathway component TatC